MKKIIISLVFALLFIAQLRAQVISYFDAAFEIDTIASKHHLRSKKTRLLKHDGHDSILYSVNYDVKGYTESLHEVQNNDTLYSEIYEIKRNNKQIAHCKMSSKHSLFSQYRSYRVVNEYKELPVDKRGNLHRTSIYEKMSDTLILAYYWGDKFLYTSDTVLIFSQPTLPSSSMLRFNDFGLIENMSSYTKEFQNTSIAIYGNKNEQIVLNAKQKIMFYYDKMTHKSANYSYDEQGKMAIITLSENGIAKSHTNIEYNQEQKIRLIDEKLGNDVYEAKKVYDRFNRIIEHQFMASIDNKMQNVKVLYEYDKIGLLIKMQTYLSANLTETEYYEYLKY